MTNGRSRRAYSEEIQAAALADLVLLGAGATAAKYGIPSGTLRSWQSQNNPVATLKKERLGALAATYLEANLQALTAQAYVASEPEYIKQQSAADLAILHGVMADKSVRLLEALHPHADDPEPAALDSRDVYRADTP